MSLNSLCFGLFPFNITYYLPNNFQRLLRDRKMIFILLSIILLWSTILFEMQNLKRKILFLSKDLMVPLMLISLIFVNSFNWGHKVTFIDYVTEELQRLKNGLRCRSATFLRKYSITIVFQMVLWNFAEQTSLTVLSLSQLPKKWLRSI